MSSFDQTRWADRGFAREYLDHADQYIPDRFYLFHVMRSFYRAFVPRTARPRVCDLGCGDGILTDQLLREDPSLEATLLDGAGEMLEAARRRLAQRPHTRFVQQSFDELVRDSSTLGTFHFIMSSFAIHHLPGQERRGLFATVLRHLEPGGCLMNIEIGLPDQGTFTDWYYRLWQEWIQRRGQLLGLGDQFQDVPGKARENPDNQYSPLTEQLADLSAAGFRDVECHYKNGLFVIYSGRSN